MVMKIHQESRLKSYLEVFPFLCGYPWMFLRPIEDKEGPDHEPEHAQGPEHVEHALPSEGLAEDPGERQRDHSPE